MKQIEIGNPLPNWKLEQIFGDTVPNVEDYKGEAFVNPFF